MQKKIVLKDPDGEYVEEIWYNNCFCTPNAKEAHDFSVIGGNKVSDSKGKANALAFKREMFPYERGWKICEIIHFQLNPPKKTMKKRTEYPSYQVSLKKKRDDVLKNLKTLKCVDCGLIIENAKKSTRKYCDKCLKGVYKKTY